MIPPATPAEEVRLGAVDESGLVAGGDDFSLNRVVGVVVVGGGVEVVLACLCSWASRKASISAQRFVNAVETFFWPVARWRFSASLLVASRSSR